MRMRRNESSAAARTVFLDVRDPDGGWVLPTALTVANLLYDDGTGVMALAGGTLATRSKPYTFTSFTFTTTFATGTINKVAHGLSTGDGPVQLTTTGTLPSGYALATNYWVISTGSDTLKLASSLANALAGTFVVISSNGTGTHTLAAVAGTKRLMNGQFLYTATQAETNVVSSWFSITVEESASFSKTEQTIDLYTREMDEILVGSHTRADIERLMLAVEAGPATGFVVGTIVFKCPITGTVRLTATLVPDGRSAPTFIIGTLS